MKMAKAKPLGPRLKALLAKHADFIRTLGKRVVKDIIEIGRRLTLVKEQVGHGHYIDWLEKEFDWSEGTALNFMQVYKLVEELKSKNKNFTDLNIANLNIAPSAMYALARPSTRPEVREEIMERAAAGETITHKTVQKARKGANGSPKSGPDNAQAQEPADWRLRDARPWYADVQEIAVQATICEYVRQEYLDPTVLDKSIDNLDQFLDALGKGGEALIGLRDKIKRALAPPPPPMFDNPTQIKH